MKKILGGIAAVAVVGYAGHKYMQHHHHMEGNKFLAETINNNVAQEFNAWCAKYNKSYNTEEEYAERFAIFARNLHEIQLHNLSNTTYQQGINEFADMTTEEYKNFVGTRRNPFHIDGTEWKIRANPDATYKPIDWQEKGAVTPVKKLKRICLFRKTDQSNTRLLQKPFLTHHNKLD